MRAIEADDAEWLAVESADPDVQRFTPIPAGLTAETLRPWAASRRQSAEKGESIDWIFVEQTTGERAGQISLVRFNWKDSVAEIAYWTAAAFRKRGLTTAAVRLVSSWGMEVLDLWRIELITDPANAGSRRVAALTGFESEGVLRQYRAIKGRHISLVMHSKVRDSSHA